VEGITFWYPNQVWAITSPTQAFTTYPAAIQLGDATDPGPFHPAVKYCHFLGATRCIGQYATDGTSLKGGDIEGCTGVLLGEFLRVARATEVIHVRHCHFTPNAITSYVADASVGGNAQAFRTLCARTAKVFHLGNVDDIEVVDVFAYGVLHFAHWNNSFYSGDTDEGFGGSFTNCAADGCYQAYRLDRFGNVFPLNVSNGWYHIAVRPEGAATDSDKQALLYNRSGMSQIRANFSNLRVYAATVNEFTTNYSGIANHAFVGAGAYGTGANIKFVGCDFSVSSSVVHADFEGVVNKGLHAWNDVMQPLEVVGEVPASSTSAGRAGQFVANATHLFVCKSNDSWSRITLTGW